jgi:hypothetical protein
MGPRTRSVTAQSAHSDDMTTSPHRFYGPRPCDGDCRTEQDLWHGGDASTIVVPDEDCEVHGSPAAVERRLIRELEAARAFPGMDAVVTATERELAAHRAKHHLEVQQ